MQLTVQGKQIDLGDALRTHVADKLEEVNNKYFNHASFATVTFSREGHGHGLIRAHIQIRVGKNIHVLGEAVEGDPYAAFDAATTKVAKQLRRYKRRLRDHHDRLEKTPETEIEKARSYVLAAGADDAEDETDDDLQAQDEAPTVVAELTTDIQIMSVSDAVMRLDLAGQTALLFRNASNKEINMVYRRTDGNIGWVDPAGNSKERKELQAAE